MLLLDLGRTAEVKALAPDLARLFNAQGIQRAALAGRVLRFLFRARHDEGLRFRAE